MCSEVGYWRWLGGGALKISKTLFNEIRNKRSVLALTMVYFGFVIIFGFGIYFENIAFALVGLLVLFFGMTYVIYIKIGKEDC